MTGISNLNLNTSLLLTFLLMVFVGNPVLAQEAYQDSIKVLIDNGEFESALELIEETEAQVGNKNEWLNLHRGFVLIQMKRYDEAIKYYKKLIKRYKSNPEPINNLGVIYRLQGNIELAIETLKIGISKFPDYDKLYENLGDTYLQIAQETYAVGAQTNNPTATLVIKSDLSKHFHQVVLENLALISSQQMRIEQGIVSNDVEAIEQKASTSTERPPDVELMETLQSWVDAWSSLEADQYLSHYSNEFIPEDGSDLGNWVKMRTAALEQAEFIRISLQEINIELVTPSFVVASFIEQYESNLTRSDQHKQLSFRKSEGKWLITDERNLNNQ